MVSEQSYIYAFSRRFYSKRLTGYTFFVSMCVPWELNPQPFALLTQCSTTKPQEHTELVDPWPKPSLAGFYQIQICLDWITTQYCYWYIFLSLKTSPTYFYTFPLLENNEECKFLWQELQCELFMSCEINLKSASIQCMAQGLWTQHFCSLLDWIQIPLIFQCGEYRDNSGYFKCDKRPGWSKHQSRSPFQIYVIASSS